jgi:hypothetical protein
MFIPFIIPVGLVEFLVSNQIANGVFLLGSLAILAMAAAIAQKKTAKKFGRNK